MQIYQDKSWLYFNYVECKKSTTRMAKEANCDASAISYWLKKNNIRVRKTGEGLKGRKWTDEQKATLVGRNTRPEIVIDPDWLSYHYETLNETTYEIAKHVGCGPYCIQRRLHSLGIKLRRGIRKGHHSEHALKMRSDAWKGDKNPMFGSHRVGNANPMYGRRGPDNPQWRGGSSFKPYCIKFNREFKERIRDKFNRKCFVCGGVEDVRKHHVHHIDYNKNAICNGKEWAFVPLCIRHHAKSNQNRWRWFNLLINYWATNPEINISEEFREWQIIPFHHHI